MSVRPQVVVYVKPGSAQCGAAVATVERVQKKVSFELQKVDVSQDSSLGEKYGSKVPVITINGKQAFEGRVAESAFRSRVKKAQLEQGQPAEPVIVEALQPAGRSKPALPSALVAVVLAVVTLGVLYFVREGIAEAALGRGRLARELLKVEARNDTPPPFDLESLTGERVVSGDRFRNRVVFINFWATWCPPCVEEMPSMLRLQAKMNDDPKFEMLAISADEEWAPIRKFFERAPNLDVLLDASGKLAREYGTEKFPETYIVVDGRLIGYIVGPRDWDTWYAEAYLRALSEHGTAL